MKSTFTFGSLFSGIGGIDLGLERAGMTCKWQVENDEFCQRVLAKHWPDVTRFGDIRSVGLEQLTDVDLICGGFPCQDISNAGKRAGIDGERSGLWREFARIIGVLRPPIVLMENVAAITVRGIDRVLGDLASCGYDAEWTCFRAADVGAYHLRNRWWCVAANSILPRLEVGTCFGGDFAEELAAAFRSHRSEGGIWETFTTVGALADGVQHRVAKLRSIGNSVVPQVAELIGKRIMRAAPASPGNHREPEDRRLGMGNTLRIS